MTTKNQTKITAEPGKQEIFIEREFDAPRELVFQAFADPKLLVHWVGPNNMKMRITKHENKAGGSWRFVHTDDKGNEAAFNGVMHDVEKPSRMVRTFEFEGLPEKGHVSLEFLDLIELPGGRTKAKMQSIFKSVMDRDGMINSGMERGVVEGFNRLDDVLAKSKNGIPS